MPLGFLGSIAVALLVPVSVALLYAFAWPVVVAQRGWFVLLTVVVAVAVGAVAWWWAYSPLTSIGISGAPQAGGQSWEAFMGTLRARCILAVLGAAVAESVVCVAVARLLKGSSLAL